MLEVPEDGARRGLIAARRPMAILRKVETRPRQIVEKVDPLDACTTTTLPQPPVRGRRIEPGRQRRCFDLHPLRQDCNNGADPSLAAELSETSEQHAGRIPASLCLLRINSETLGLRTAAIPKQVIEVRVPRQSQPRGKRQSPTLRASRDEAAIPQHHRQPWRGVVRDIVAYKKSEQDNVRRERESFFFEARQL